MANSIEILENTLLKLIVRQGSDLERKNITLNSGELGYTIDQDRLFIGDGETLGGVAVGNKYLGENLNVTAFAAAQVGDLAFSTSDKSLYVCTGANPTNISNWKKVAAVVSAGNSISIDNSTNTISISSDRIKTNAVSTYDSEYLQLPEKLSLNSINYTWPAGGLQSDLFLSTDIFGNLTWKAPTAQPQNTYFNSSASSRIPVGTIIAFVSGSIIPSGWLLCDGQQVDGTVYPELSAAIGTTYGGTGIYFNVPDLTNKTLYGVITNPKNSTLYALSTGVNSPLSATGTNFIIKSTGEPLVNSTLRINSPLSATVNGVNATNSMITTLSGNIDVGLPRITTAKPIASQFNIDDFGRVTGSNSIRAGILSGSGLSQVINPDGYIKFLKQPYKLTDLSDGMVGLSSISVYPNINGNSSISLPIDVKTVLLESSLTLKAYSNTAVIFAASDLASLNTDTAAIVPNNSEITVNKIISRGWVNVIHSTQQVMVPLSSNGSVTSFGLRMRLGNLDETGFIKILGYTV
jgi:microcystin-dependent protein